jgi:F420-dependent oxidoreductase-like protein
MGGEHRADAAVAIRVGADDDLVGLDALEHGDPGPSRKAIDRGAQGLKWWAATFCHRVQGPQGARATVIPPVVPLKRSPRRERNFSTMKLGVHVGYWGLGMGPQDQLEVVQEAERLGYDSVWAAEAYGSDAATVLAWLAAGTTKIRLGSAIFQMPGRSAAMTAMTAATIDELSGGRMILGIGSSGPQVAEGWHGQRFARQLKRTREYVAVVRMALARERVEFHGDTLELPLPDGPGKALKLMISPVQERIPIYVAAIGPKNTALAGEIADGWIPTFFSPDHVAEFRQLLEEGAARAGRSLNGFDIAPTVNAYVSDDRELARNLMRPVLALYIGGMGSREQNFYNNLVQRYGFEPAAREIQDLYLEGKKAEAGEAIPDELIDLVSLCGPRDVVRERIGAFRAAGVGTLMITPMAFTAEDRINQLREIAELAS